MVGNHQLPKAESAMNSPDRVWDSVDIPGLPDKFVAVDASVDRGELTDDRPDDRFDTEHIELFDAMDRQPVVSRRLLAIWVACFGIVVAVVAFGAAAVAAQDRDIGSYPSPEWGIPEACGATAALTGKTFTVTTTGETSSRLADLTVAPGDTILFEWNVSAVPEWCDGARVSLAAKDASATGGMFDPTVDQRLVVFATAPIDHGAVELTLPAAGCGQSGWQIDAVLGDPLPIVGPSGSYYSPEHRMSALADSRSMLADAVNTPVDCGTAPPTATTPPTTTAPPTVPPTVPPTATTPPATVAPPVTATPPTAPPTVPPTVPTTVCVDGQWDGTGCVIETTPVCPDASEQPEGVCGSIIEPVPPVTLPETGGSHRALSMGALAAIAAGAAALAAARTVRADR